MQFKHIALVLVSGIVFSGCSLFPQKDQQLPLEQPVKTQVEETGKMPADAESETETTKQEAMTEGKVVFVVANDFSYDVSEIKVKKGEKLTVSVMNNQGIHDFVIDELAINSGMIKENETIELEISTDKPGTYEFYCSVGQHRKMGMKGTLIVE